MDMDSLVKLHAMHLARIPRLALRRHALTTWKLAVRVLGRARNVEGTKGKIRLLVHPSSFGEMAPSNLHGYPRALSDNYNICTRIAYHAIGPDRPELWPNIQ
jgi:hypothetical protein